jgi:hypothetical protein
MSLPILCLLCKSLEALKPYLCYYIPLFSMRDIHGYKWSSKYIRKFHWVLCVYGKSRTIWGIPVLKGTITKAVAQVSCLLTLTFSSLKNLTQFVIWHLWSTLQNFKVCLANYEEDDALYSEPLTLRGRLCFVRNLQMT